MDLGLEVNYNIHRHFDVEIYLDLDQNWLYELVLHVLTWDTNVDTNVAVDVVDIDVNLPTHLSAPHILLAGGCYV